MKIFENSFPIDLLNRIQKESIQLREETIWRSNLTWDKNIVKSSSLVLIRHLNETDTAQLKKRMLELGVIDSEPDLTFRAMTYLWSNLSYIPWHLDKNWIGAATLYLNSNWDPDWGGYLMWEDQDGIHASPPEFNRMAVNNSNVKHSTSLTTKDADLRETIQMFWF